MEGPNYEQFVYPDVAIALEKEIKGWRRSKKIRFLNDASRTLVHPSQTTTKHFR